MFLTLDPHQTWAEQIKVQSAERFYVSPTKEVAQRVSKNLATDPHDLARPSLANYVSEMLGCNTVIQAMAATVDLTATSH